MKTKLRKLAVPLVVAAAILAYVFSGTIVDAGHRVLSRTRAVTVVLPDGTVVERTRGMARGIRGVRGSDFGSCAGRGSDFGSCSQGGDFGSCDRGNDAGSCDSGMLWMRW